MKKCLCALLMLSLTSVFAIEVDEPELMSTGSDSVQFENYMGPYAVIETAQAITNIGTDLGRVVARDISSPVTVRPEGKYTLIHAVDMATPEGLDADILVLNDNAGVDHIKNLRRIITGYLMAAYGYEQRDAESVAVFVTVYNAVYRNQLSYFAGKYKDAVLSNLSEEKVGLSTVWSEWPGRTQIVIPLSDIEEGVSPVDTTVISDPKVVEALRQEEDRGIEARETLTEIKEREVQNATERAQEAQREAATLRAEAATAATPEEREAATQKAEAAAATATEQQQIADRKQVEVTNDRLEIARDRQALMRQSAAETRHITGLFGASDRTGLYTLVMLDMDTGKIVRASPVSQVRGKTVYLVGGVTLGEKTFDSLYLAVCGVNDGHSAVRLCLIDTERLELQKQSDEVLSESTEFIEHNGAYYVIVQEGTSCFVGKYDKSATLIAKSAVPVKATTPLTITEQGILATETNGRPRLLNAEDLSTIW